MVDILIGFVVMHYTAGLILSLVFQLAHVIEDAEMPRSRHFWNNEKHLGDSPTSHYSQFFYQKQIHELVYWRFKPPD